MAFALLEKLSSLFLIMLAGFVVVRLGVLRSQDSHPLSVLCLYIICPCCIFSAFLMPRSAEILSGLLLCTIASALSLGSMIFLNTLLRKPLRLSPAEQCSVIYTNAGNLLIPLVSSILGPEWVIYTCAFMLIQIPLQWSHCKSIICCDPHIELRKIILNPNILAIACGLLVFASGVKLPLLILDTVDAVGVTIGPVTMLIVGMLIADMDIKQVFLNGRTWLVAALRLVVMPLILILPLQLLAKVYPLADAKNLLLITFMATCAPAAATVTQLAQVYTDDPNPACAINVMTNIICIVTMPIMIAVFQL